MKRRLDARYSRFKREVAGTKISRARVRWTGASGRTEGQGQDADEDLEADEKERADQGNIFHPVPEKGLATLGLR